MPTFRGGKREFTSTAKAAIILLTVTVLFYWKTLLTHQFSYLTGYEGVNQAYAWLNFLVRGIKAGSWPLWDSYVFSGRSFSGEMQTGAFYPLYLPLALFRWNDNGVLAPALYHIMYAGVHFLGAYLMFRLLRELDLSMFAGLVGGICFSLGGVLGRIPGWPHLLNSGIWLPLIFLFLLRAMRAALPGPRFLYAAACGISLGMSILAGGLHFAIMQAIVTLTAVIFWVLVTKPDWKQAVLIIAVAAIVAFASGGVQLLPSIEYGGLALRGVGPAAFAASKRIPYHYMSDGLSAHGLIYFLIAFAYGGLAQGEAINPYFGVFPFLLAVIGIWKNWRHPWVRYLTGLAVAAFAYSLGFASILHGVLYVLAPYLWLAREADRFMYLADFALAVLAAYGAEALFCTADGAWEPLGKILKWVAVAAVAALALPALYAQLSTNLWVSLSLLLIVVSWLLFRHVVSGHTGTLTRALALALILFDLYAFDWSAIDRIEASAKGRDEMRRLLSFGPATRFLKAQPGPFRVQMAMDSAPNIGDVFQIQTTGGAGVTVLKDYATIVGQTDLLNVRYVVKPAATPDAGAVYQDSTWKVYENPRAYPRGWIVHQVIVESSADVSGIDLHRTALLTTRLETPLYAAPDTAGEYVHFDQYEANRMDVKVHANGRGLLVLSEIYYPGWMATVNGHPARIWKVDGALRGVVIPAGNSHCTLRYRPASVYAGAWLSGATLGILWLAPAGLWLVRRRVTSRAYPDRP